MTIVSTSHRFLYIHIPKTAGSTVKQHLSAHTRYCDVEVGGSAQAELIAPYYAERFGLRKHSPAMEIRQAIGEQDFEALFKFTFVRNPFTRAVSTFNFLKNTWRAWTGSEIMDGFDSLEALVTSDFFKTRGPDRIFEPQMRWLVGPDGRRCVNFIGRLETLEPDMEALCRRLKLPPPAGLSWLNASRITLGGEDVTAITAKVADAIRARYPRDFASLGYSDDPERRFEGRVGK